MHRFVTVVVALAATACASSQKSEPTVKSQPAPEVRGESDSNHATCVAMFVRQRECTDLYIPALVDLSISVKRYGDIEDTREELIAQALKEWEVDSTDTAIEGTCRTALDISDSNFIEQQVPVIEACLAASDCQAFIDCIIPATRVWWEHRAQDKQQQK